MLLFAAFDNSLKVQRYSINSNKIENAVNVVVISDLHSKNFGENQQDLLDIIAKQNPDAIFLTGDIIDHIFSHSAAETFLQGIQNICPVYYVTGNHECQSRDIEAILDTILKYDVKILSGNYELLNINGNKFVIGGIDDPSKKKYSQDYDQESVMEQAFSDLPSDSYSVLLAHRPEQIENYKQYDFDLVVSGHAHGGQFRIPYILNGMYAPNQGWFPQYAGGLYKHGDLSHIVSRGLGNNVPIPRIFNPPEVVVIDIVPC